MSTTRQPTLFLSHGAPPLADDATWTRELRGWSDALPTPKNILMVSAHWEAAPPTLGAHRHAAPLLHDFWGFTAKYYDVTYEAPTAPELAARVASLLGDHGATAGHDEDRGLDHGVYVPLRELFPRADVPVLQMSMPTLAPAELFDLGRALAPLREEGTLIIGSGFTTHNLRWFDPRQGADAPAPAASAEFDAWAEETTAAKDVDGLLDVARRAPAADVAHPRTEHWAPFYIALGAAAAGGEFTAESTIDGFWYGLSKRSWQFA